MKTRIAVFAICCLAALTGCAPRSAKVIMPDVNQPVVMGSMIGINTKLPAGSKRDGNVTGVERYDHSDNWMFGFPISSTEEYSNIQQPLLRKLGLSQDKCVTNLNIEVVSEKSRGIYTFYESVKIGYDGDVYTLNKSDRKE